MDSKTKILIGVAIVTAVAMALVLIANSFPAKLSGQFMMTYISGGVMIQGKIKNSGAFVANNVTIHFEFYDQQGNVLRTFDYQAGDIGPFGEKDITLRFRVDAWDFRWWFVNPKG